MSALLDELRQRKTTGVGEIEPYGDEFAYTDPRTGIAEQDSENEITWFVVSTEDVDRDGDIVRSGPNHWDTEAYFRGSASWLWDHGEMGDSRPIGVCKHPVTKEPLIRYENGRTLAGIAWDSGPWGREIKGLVDRDQVSGASIGFVPTSGRPIRKEGGLGTGRDKPAYDIDGLELFELTITPTPANRHAMRLAVDRGEGSPVILKSFRKALGTMSDTAGGSLGAGTEEKAIDEEFARHKAALDDCVGRKVKILMDEGKEQKQALAIAYSMCGEKALHPDDDDEAIRKRTKAVDMDIPDDTTAATAVVPDEQPTSAEMPDTPDKPRGATVLLNCIEHIQALKDYLEGESPGLEPDSTVKDFIDGELSDVLAELHDRLHEVGGDTYEGEDFTQPDEAEEAPEEEGSESPEEGPEEEDMEEEEGTEEEKSENDSGEEKEEGMTEEEEKKEADEYTKPEGKRIASYRRKHARRKAYRVSKGMAGACTKAADYLDNEMSGHLEKSAEGEMPAAMHLGYAAMCRKHAQGLRLAVGGEDKVPEGTSAPEEGPAREDVMETKSVGWGTVMSELTAARQDFSRVLGR